MSNLKKIPIEQTTLSNDFSNTYKSEVDTAYTNNHTHSNKSILDTVSGSNTGDETLSTILTKIFANKVTCSTASATADKAVTLSGFSLVSGITVKVAFTNANTTASPTLNVSSTGAKAIYSEDGVAVSATNPFYVPAGATVEFTYDGTNWVYKNRIVASYVNGASFYEQYTNGKIRQGGTYTATADGTATITLLKTFSNTQYKLLVQSISTTGNSSTASNIGVYYYTGITYSKSTASFILWTFLTFGCSYDWIAEGY